MRYFSAVKDHLVTRYGTGTYIGASVRVVQEGSERGQTKIEYDTDQIVCIPDGEFSQYSREYIVCLRDGSLIERTEAEYKTLLAKHDAAVKKEAEARKVAEEKVAVDAEATAKHEREEKKKAIAAEREAEAQSKAGSNPES